MISSSAAKRHSSGGVSGRLGAAAMAARVISRNKVRRRFNILIIDCRLQLLTWCAGTGIFNARMEGGVIECMATARHIGLASTFLARH